jgi:hypothetical protein
VQLHSAVNPNRQLSICRRFGGFIVAGATASLFVNRFLGVDELTDVGLQYPSLVDILLDALRHQLQTR